MSPSPRSSRRRHNGPLLLAIDQGTTSTKALLVSTGLDVVAEASREFRQHFPQPGWVEHDLDDIWASVRLSVRDVLQASRARTSDIVGIGITNQRETTAVWDRRTGRPYHRAIVWQDRRTEPRCAELRKEGLEPDIRRRTGLVVDPYFSGTKLAWLLEHVGGLGRAARSGRALFGTIDTYLLWRLTGGAVHATDVSNASRTLLMDLRACRWSPELLEILEVPPAMLPEIRGHDEPFGWTRGTRWLPDGIPIGSLIGDQQSALFGQACFEPGEAKCTYGTGAFLVVNTGSRLARSRHGLLSTAAWLRNGKTVYALEGATFIAGAIVQWLRDGLGLIKTSAEVNDLARTVRDSEGVSLVPALTGLGAPHWDPHARGLLCGLSRGTTAGHVARAALEGIAFQIRDLVTTMERDAKLELPTLRADGGATASRMLMQFQADILGIPLVVPRCPSTTALGAAALAGLVTGAFPSQEAVRKAWKAGARYRPRMVEDERERRVKTWSIAVKRALEG